MANMVSVLIEYPSAASMAKVPSRTTGIAMIGISVARQFCRKIRMTRNTSTMASARVCQTFSMDSSTKGAVS